MYIKREYIGKVWKKRGGEGLEIGIFILFYLIFFIYPYFPSCGGEGHALMDGR